METRHCTKIIYMERPGENDLQLEQRPIALNNNFNPRPYQPTEGLHKQTVLALINAQLAAEKEAIQIVEQPPLRPVHPLWKEIINDKR